MVGLISYDVLKVIWFLLWGLLWAVYFILDGFDLGMGSLLPIIAKTEDDRRVIYNAAGPFWDGNEVWLITAGGVTFAAFPLAYATMFSALYAPLLILLFALIFRGVTFEYRNKVDNPEWRTLTDILHSVGSFVPALLLGVAFANLFKGIPIDYEGVYHGNLLTLLNPYGLLGGILFVLMFCMQGVLFLALKSVGDIHERAKAYGRMIWPALAAVSVAFLFATKFYTNLYENYMSIPALLVIPVGAVAALFLLRFFLAGERLGLSFLTSSLYILLVTFFGIIGMFPALIPSSLSPEFSVTIERAASSELTLTIMLVTVLIFVPIVIFYQAWNYYTFSEKITPEVLDSDQSY